MGEDGSVARILLMEELLLKLHYALSMSLKIAFMVELVEEVLCSVILVHGYRVGS